MLIYLSKLRKKKTLIVLIMIDKEIGIQFVLIDLIDGVVAGLKGLQGHNVGHVHILGYTNDPLYLQGENRLLMFLLL